MVTLLTEHDRAAIAAAVSAAEQNTSAEIVLVLTPASSLHADFVLLFGLIVSSLATLLLYGFGAHNYPELLTTQLGLLVLIFFVPPLRRLCWRYIPAHIAQKRSASRALEEYSLIHRQNPADLPLVLLFVSLGEHYAHVMPSHAIYEKIQDGQWDEVIATFTGKLRSDDLTGACCAAIAHIGAIVSGPFPENGGHNALADHVLIR